MPHLIVTFASFQRKQKSARKRHMKAPEYVFVKAPMQHPPQRAFILLYAVLLSSRRKAPFRL